MPVTRSPNHQDSDVSDTDLLEARRIAAIVVKQLGEKYWPLFNRIDEEWRMRADRRARLDACLTGAGRRLDEPTSGITTQTDKA